MIDEFDVCIVGAGVVGLAIARQLAQDSSSPPRSILLLEGETSFGQRTSSRNSEVIHAGIYYQPDSLKAALCLEGKGLLYAYLQNKNIPYKRAGKLIVAKASQRWQLEKIEANAIASGVDDLSLLTVSQVNSLESNLSDCYAIYSPSTGIFDSHAFMVELLNDAQNLGVTYVANTRVTEIRAENRHFVIDTQFRDRQGSTESANYTLKSQYLINSAGLKAVSVANRITGTKPANIPEVHLCKGDYFSYPGKAPFSHLIYPVPEENNAGLGIHSTLDLSGQVKFGPDTEYLNEEDYSVDINKRELFAEAISQYYPKIDKSRLSPAYSGIRPKLSARGEPAQDFLIQGESQHGVPGLVQLFGIESPGLTSSLAIAKQVSKFCSD